MGKSVYSMVLSDEVIALIDEKALKSGKSRSQIINEILAQHVGFSTQNQRIKELFASVNAIMEGHRRIRAIQSQQSTIDFLSAINYKYSPRVTYSVALFPGGQEEGLLKIALRTTNSLLISVINCFFDRYINLEKLYLKGASYQTVDGKLLRRLDFARIQSVEHLAEKLTEYVNNLDKLINLYIEDYPYGLADQNLEKNFLLIKDGIVF